jgi:peptidoglycan/LPS O-acetylase OafA/YrhL
MPEATPRIQARFVHIDCLRGLAALLVALHHFVGGSIQETGATGPLARTVETVLYEFVDMGRLGVLLFFLLSGYCIANSILRPVPHPIASFAINRVFRIFPAYWLSLAIAGLVYGAAIPREVYLINIPLLQTYLGQPDVIGVYWTLAVELAFYALCVFLFVIGVMGNIRRLQVMCIAFFGWAVLAAILRYTAEIAAPYAWPFFLSLMLCGAVLRRRDDLGYGTLRLIWIAMPIALIGLLVIAVGVYSDAATFDKSWYREFIPAASALILFVGLTYIYRPRSAVLAYLGRISYSLYLLHSLVFLILMRTSPVLANALTATGPVALALILLGATIGLAALSYAAAEWPGIRIGHRLAASLPGREPRTEAARP